MLAEALEGLRRENIVAGNVIMSNVIPSNIEGAARVTTCFRTDLSTALEMTMKATMLEMTV